MYFLYILIIVFLVWWWARGVFADDYAAAKKHVPDHELMVEQQLARRNAEGFSSVLSSSLTGTDHEGFGYTKQQIGKARNTLQIDEFNPGKEIYGGDVIFMKNTRARHSELNNADLVLKPIPYTNTPQLVNSSRVGIVVAEDHPNLSRSVHYTIA